MTELAAKHCVPCHGGVPPLGPDERQSLLAELGPNGWQVVDGQRLEKDYEFPDFARALAFTDRVGALAEEQGHHPDIHLAWGKVGLVIWTHAVGGLTESDFVLAAKADRVL